MYIQKFTDLIERLGFASAFKTDDFEKWIGEHLGTWLSGVNEGEAFQKIQEFMAEKFPHGYEK